MKARFGRRGFVQGSLAALACARVPRLRRASDDLRVAVVGLNGRGAQHIDTLQGMSGVRLAVLCDVDDHVLLREHRRQRQRSLRPDVHSDLRHVLERADVDAVALATPNHWHALQAIWACQAGKHVFVESPLTHVHAEGERMLAAARKHGRRVQGGFAARSSPALGAALEWLRAGELGALELVRGICHVARPTLGRVRGNQRLPEGVDYDLWCGPAPLEPLRRARLHGDWRWFWATGDGALGDEGAEVLDLARWVLGTEEPPASVLSLGARLGYEDDGQTPNTQLVFYAFEPVPLLCELRGLPRDRAAQEGEWSAAMDDFLGVRAGVVAHCVDGSLRLHLPARDGAPAAVACDAEGREIRRWEEGAGPEPLAGWIAALQGGQAAETGELELGLRSNALVHLGNVSQRLARALEPAALLKEVESSATLSKSCAGVLAHLEANGVDLAQGKLALGPCLVLDAARGCFQEHERANELLAGHFRVPYTLPAV